MNKNTVALAVYRTVKAANDDNPASEFRGSAPPHLPLSGRSGWDPFEVWRTRIRVEAVPGRHSKA